MRLFSLFISFLAVSTAAFAQTGNSIPAEVANSAKVVQTRTKVTCALDQVENVTFPGREPYIVKTNGKVTESIRTAWISNGTEFRFSETKHFRENGKKQSAESRIISRIEKSQNGSRETEKIKSTQIYRNLSEYPLAGGDLREFSIESEDVYERNGSERLLVSSVVDGKPSETRGLREQMITLNANQEVLRSIEQVPYTYDLDGAKYEVLKSELTCVIKELK